MAHLKWLHLDHFSGKKFTNTAFPLQQSPAFFFFFPFSSTHPWLSFKAKMDRAVLLPPCPFFAIACEKGRSEGFFTLRNSGAVILPCFLLIFNSFKCQNLLLSLNAWLLLRIMPIPGQQTIHTGEHERLSSTQPPALNFKSHFVTFPAIHRYLSLYVFHQS